MCDIAVCGLVAQLCLTLCDPMEYSWPGFCPWNSPGKNTEGSNSFLSLGDLPNPGIKPRSPALQAVSLYLSPHGLLHIIKNCIILIWNLPIAQ